MGKLEQEMKEKKHREKLEKEQANLETKEIIDDYKRLAKDQQEKERLEKEKIEKEEKEIKKLEKERKEQEQHERREQKLQEEKELKQKKNKEKLEKERAELEAKENKRLAKEQKEKDERMKKEQKKAKELEEKERKMNEKLEKERREKKEKEKREVEQTILKQKKEAEELEIKERKSQERKDNEKRALLEKETKKLPKEITTREEKSKKGHVESEHAQEIMKSEKDDHHLGDMAEQKLGILNFDSQDAPHMIEKERIYDKECSSHKDEVELPLEERVIQSMSSLDPEALIQPAETKRHPRDETKQSSNPFEGDESDSVSAKDSSFTLRPHLSQQTMDDTLSITSLPTDTQQQLIDDHAKEVSTEDKTIIHKSIDNINDGESKSQTYAQSLDVFNESNT